MASIGGIDDVDFVALGLAGFAFVLFTEQTANMRGSSRTLVGVKDFQARSATLSRILL